METDEEKKGIVKIRKKKGSRARILCFFLYYWYPVEYDDEAAAFCLLPFYCNIYFFLFALFFLFFYDSQTYGYEEPKHRFSILSQRCAMSFVQPPPSTNLSGYG